MSVKDHLTILWLILLLLVCHFLQDIQLKSLSLIDGKFINLVEKIIENIGLIIK